MNRFVSASASLIVLALVTAASAEPATSDSSASESKVLWGSGDINASVGVRLWYNQWDVPVFDTVALARPSGGFVLQDTVTTSPSAFKLGVIPFGGLRIGNVVASVSYLTRTNYDAQSAIVSSASRDEFDATLGYSVFPASSEGSLVISGGYKTAKISESEASSALGSLNVDTRINGALIGVSGSAPLMSDLRLYGSAAYGWARQKTSFSGAPPTPGTQANSSRDGRYGVGEVGLSYLFFHGAAGQALSSAVVALGYRAQSYTIKSFTLFTLDPSSLSVIGSETRDITSNTQGAVLTLSASF